MSAPEGDVNGSSRCLVVGATGFIGSRLVSRLLDAGHQVRILARSPEKVGDARAQVQAGDATSYEAVFHALDDIEVAYFLVHSLDRDDFEAVDRQAATVMAAAAAARGVAQLVYLGGPRTDTESVSAHLRSRAEVGDIFLASDTSALVLQASMVIGRGSSSFELLMAATQLPGVMVTPRWAENVSRPVALRDLLHYLVLAADRNYWGDALLAVSGPEQISYADLMRRCTRIRGLPTAVALHAPLWSHRISGAFAGVFTALSGRAASALFESLDYSLPPDADDATTLMPTPEHGVTTIDNAIRLAVGDDGDTTAASADTYRAVHDLACVASAQQLWHTITGLGGSTGWRTIPGVWAARGALDHLLGGVGLYRGRQSVLSEGDVLDFWTVVQRDDHRRSLTLRADMTMPGEALLTMSVDDSCSPIRYHQVVEFIPRGLAGRLYWYAQKPLHDIVFGVMARNVVSAAQRAQGRS